MTLLERIQNTTVQTSKESSYSNRQIAYLKRQVKEYVSIDEIAAMMVEHSTRAQNEIRSACRRAFEDPFWNECSVTEQETLTQTIINTVFGLGPIQSMVNDPEITEIMINGAHSIYYEKNGKLYKSDKAFANDSEVRSLIDRILGPIGRRIDESSPMVNARLSAGHRVNAIVPPLSLNGPVLTIRKFSEQVITLEQMVSKKSFDNNVAKFLQWSVLIRKNIAVSGGTGSGKTTLLNALSCLIPFEERIITIEDSAELRFFEHPHVVSLEARPKSAEGTGEVSIRDLVINALRMRPDRIVVGECRGGEALDMLQAMTTGHDGSLTTLHANSPQEVISRLTTMVRYVADLPADVIESYIASALDIVIQTARALDGSRYISEIVDFSLDNKTHKCVLSSIYKKDPFDKQGHWNTLPNWINDLPKYGYVKKEAFDLWRLQL